jgi:YesN/AraC family two-component response regulator
MNENYLSKLFLKVVGIRFKQYLTDYRINKAQSLLQENPDIKMIAICQELGLANNPTYFSTLFKNQTGMTITEYRKSIIG